MHAQIFMRGIERAKAGPEATQPKGWPHQAETRMTGRHSDHASIIGPSSILNQVDRPSAPSSVFLEPVPEGKPTLSNFPSTDFGLTVAVGARPEYHGFAAMP